MNKKTENAIRIKLLELRTERGWSQKQVCKELEKHGVAISRSTYTKYETGDRLPSAVMVTILALCFETSADYILGLKTEK